MSTPTSADWQLRLGTFGQIVEGVDDVAQCLRILLLTPRGSVPHDPQLGCDVFRYLDRPINAARAQIVREVLDAIAYGEPRARVIRVGVDRDGSEPSSVILTIEWALAGTSGDTQSSLVAIGAAA